MRLVSRMSQCSCRILCADSRDLGGGGVMTLCTLYSCMALDNKSLVRTRKDLTPLAVAEAAFMGGLL